MHVLLKPSRDRHDLSLDQGQDRDLDREVTEPPQRDVHDNAGNGVTAVQSIPQHRRDLLRLRWERAQRLRQQQQQQLQARLALALASKDGVSSPTAIEHNPLVFGSGDTVRLRLPLSPKDATPETEYTVVLELALDGGQPRVCAARDILAWVFEDALRKAALMQCVCTRPCAFHASAARLSSCVVARGCFTCVRA